MEIEYIHYGSNKFDKNKFKEIKNENDILLTKPTGGLWASRVNSKFGWKYWCEREDFRKENLRKYFKFKLKKNSKILVIDNPEKLENLPKRNENNYLTEFNLKCKILDFEKLKENYDAIEVLLSNNYKLNSYLMFWDCDSLLVMNPNIIEEIKI